MNERPETGLISSSCCEQQLDDIRLDFSVFLPGKKPFFMSFRCAKVPFSPNLEKNLDCFSLITSSAKLHLESIFPELAKDCFP